MGTAKDWTGTQLGKLTVIEYAGNGRDHYARWRCRCACGNEIELDSRAIKRGAKKDCGCGRIAPGQVDYTGKRFGRLICLEPTAQRNKHGSVVWLCKCDCGKTCLTPAGQLTQGYKKSCGCLESPPLQDLVGNQYGKLTVIAYAGKIKGAHRWKCRCACGNETIVRQDYLFSGKRTSCGCVGLENRNKTMGFVEGTSIKIVKQFRTNLKSTNRSGYNGVFQSRSGKWIAQVMFQGKKYHLGSYADKQEAVKARAQADEKIDEVIAEYEEKHRNQAKGNIG